MAERKSLLLRIDQKLWREIEKLAHEDLRSINGEIEFLLKRAVEARRGKRKANSEERNAD
ncbi:MAG TPA: hypothetical protein VN952_04540 [Chthoniobacterales bacterium]|jgi:hypothetical protein|nr:hypothetical protein [Chthoniobacterales bacterium]